MIALLLLLAACSIEACPKSCDCKNSKLSCRIPRARKIPKFANTDKYTSLDLSENNLLNIPPNSFKNFSNLKELILDGNKIYFLENGAFKGIPRLKKLSIQHNNIHFIEDEVFDDLTELEELYLGNNNIEILPNLSKNVELKKFCVSNNKIPEISSESFTNNTQLFELKLKKNKLMSLPTDAFPDDVSKYVTLNLIGNNIRSIPDVVKKMENLESLSLCGNPLKVFQPEEFGSFRRLKSLSMTRSGILNIDAGVFAIPYLEELYLGKNHIKAGTLSNLQLPKLKRLVLTGNEIGNLTDNSLPSLLKEIQVLDLSNARISNITSETFLYFPKLRELKLNGNQLARVPNLSYNVDLKELDLSENKIEEVDSSAFRTLTLKSLSLAGNHLSNFDQIQFLNSLSITSLDLSHNRLTTVPAILTSFRNLETLNMSSNQITSLNGSLFTNLHSLKTLNLKENHVAVLPDDVFESLSSLQKLYLCKNRLETLNPIALSKLPHLEVLTANKNEILAVDDETFANNSNLEKLSLSYNNITEIAKKSFYKLTKLRHLKLLYNRLTETPKFGHNYQLQELGLCGNPLGNLPHGALNGPLGLEILLLREIGLTKFSRSVLNEVEKIKYLNLAANNLTSMPSVIKSMTSLEKLNLSGNPIAAISMSNFTGLVSLREIRLDDMNLRNFDVTKMFPALPALRTLSLGSNPWHCGCNSQWFALGIDGARTNVETVDRSLMRCSSPNRHKGKKFDYLRLGDYRHCVGSYVKKVGTTIATLSLPYIAPLASDHPQVQHYVTYSPLGVEKEKVVTFSKTMREAIIDGLTPGTHYVMCVKTSTSSQMKRNHDIRDEENEVCHKVMTRGVKDSDVKNGEKIITHQQLIIYAVLGALVLISLIATTVAIKFWCRRVSDRKRDKLGNISDIVECSANETRNPEPADHRKNELNKPEINGHDGGAMARPDNERHVIQSCDVTEEKGKTKL